jgi:8-oxo-dGTP pyrophosphatase MutT (NUDIX family)
MAVFDDRRRLLLVRRVDNGLWVLPGGKLELGESIAEAAVREVLEETGLRVAVTGFAALNTDPGHVIEYDDGTILQEFSVTLTGVPIAESELTVQAGETSEVEWFTAAQIRDLELHPAMRDRIDAALDGRQIIA